MIIKRKKSIIPACDVSFSKFLDIVRETADIDVIGGYKVGLCLSLRYGLRKVVETVRDFTDKPVIYDHQKAGTDIPYLGKGFAEVCKEAEVDAVILFPLAGPKTEEAWIHALQDEGISVIVGGSMTHPKFRKSEGGYIDDASVLDMYSIAADLGVRDFVVPGNKPSGIKVIKKEIEEKGIKPIFYAPGFITQGGKTTEAAKVAGEQWHAIVGRAVYSSKDIRKTVMKISEGLK